MHTLTGVTLAEYWRKIGNKKILFPEVPVKNVFISHIHEDDERIGQLKELLARKGYPVRDGSINKNKPNNAKNPEYIKREILRPQITWAGTLMVLITPKTRHSEWVDYEIREAVRQGKPVIGVWGRGARDCDLPDAMIEFGFRVVGWNGDSIIAALEGSKEPWEKCDGTPLPRRDLPRRCGDSVR